MNAPNDTKPQIARIPVKSKLLASLGYDEASQTLEVQFARGAVYQYQGVAPETYRDLMEAPSLGSHFLANVKDAHDFTRIEQVPQ